MENKRVLFLVNHDLVIYNFRKELVEKLLEEGYQVFISSPYGKKIDYLVDMGCVFKEISIERHGLNPFKDIQIIFEYKRLIKEIDPMAILSFTIKPNIYGAIAAKQRKVPVIANITGLGSAVENKGFLQLVTILMYKYAFTQIQTVFFQNRENLDFFVKNKIALGKHKLLPGSGVNLTHFHPLDYPKSESINFVFISRIMKEKGIDEYIKAANVIRSKYSNTSFHICGFCEEDYYEVLNEYERKDIIIYHGMIEDIRDILKITHCTIHPTYYPEGMSNVLLESCASARPIITTDRSGCKEIVDNNINGYIVKEKNEKDLIEKIEKFINLSYEEKKEMGLRAREKVEKEFDRRIVVDMYLNEL